ncbi:MAG: hypothetical protein MUP55_01655 [Candidatus Aenigmarchaeota archaeon]|nr:hypothetical protein [Candidatus Aenigmarchaeota archaeon]
MLYDAKGNLMGEAKEKRCNLLGEDITYKTIPGNEMPAGHPYVAWNLKSLLRNEKIQISADVPESIRPVMALSQYMRTTIFSENSDMLLYELEYAKELGVQEDYLKFMGSNDVFKNVRKFGNYVSRRKGENKISAKTLSKHLEQYLKEISKIGLSRERGEITDFEYRLRTQDLAEKYKDKVFWEDSYNLDEWNFKAFLEVVKRSGSRDAEGIDDIYRHEKEHFQAVEGETGIKSQKYNVHLVLEENGEMGFQPAIDRTHENLEDMLRIGRKSRQAVTEKSYLDKVALGEAE